MGPSDLLDFEVALADRGNALSVTGDGDMTLRLSVAPQYRAQVLALVDRMAKDKTVRLVAVNTGLPMPTEGRDE